MVTGGRAVTTFEHKLGVSDNELPGGKRSTDKGQFALSSYDQSILANGPPETGDGARAHLPIGACSGTTSKNKSVLQALGSQSVLQALCSRHPLAAYWYTGACHAGRGS